MSNQIIKIDFQVLETRNPQILMIGDTSTWSYAETLPSYISITLPGTENPLTYDFNKNNVCIFNTNNLGLTCTTDECKDEDLQDLPDGVYAINVKSGYEEIEKTKWYLKTDKIQLDIAREVRRNGFEYSPIDRSFRDRIYDIKWLLEVAKSEAIFGDFYNAQKYYEEAQSKLTCKNCI